MLAKEKTIAKKEVESISNTTKTIITSVVTGFSAFIVLYTLANTNPDVAQDVSTLLVVSVLAVLVCGLAGYIKKGENTELVIHYTTILDTDKTLNRLNKLIASVFEKDKYTANMYCKAVNKLLSEMDYACYCKQNIPTKHQYVSDDYLEHINLKISYSTNTLYDIEQHLWGMAQGVEPKTDEYIKIVLDELNHFSLG